MSQRAKTVFFGATLLSAFTIWGVHSLQEWERDRMYGGVLRDEERRREKQKQRQAAFDASLADRQLFEQSQKVHGNDSMSDPLPDSEYSNQNQKATTA